MSTLHFVAHPVAATSELSTPERDDVTPVVQEDEVQEEPMRWRDGPNLKPSILSNDVAAVQVRTYQRGLTARKKLNRAKPLSPKQAATARRDVIAGEEAAQKLIESMLKLSTRIVREIAEARHGREGAAPLMSDLMSEANLAVLEAAKTFDPSKEITELRRSHCKKHYRQN